MKKLSPAVKVLFVLVVLALSTALIGLVVVALAGGRDPAEKPGTKVGSGDTSAPQGTAGRTTSRRPRLPPISSRTPKPAAGPKVSAAPDAPADAAPVDDDRPKIRVLGSGDGGAVVVTSGGDGNTVKIQVGGPRGGPRSVGMLRAASAVKGMDLDAGQKDAVAKFEEVFQETIAQRLEHNQQAMKDVSDAVRAAQEANDERLMEQAREQMKAVAEAQAGTIDQLNEEYAQGVRRYLNDEQEAALDKVLQEKQPVVYGYSTVTEGASRTEVHFAPPPPAEE